MNWIRKAFVLASFLVIALFASQANHAAVQKIENKKADTTFTVQNDATSAFIQPQASYHFAANAKTDYVSVIKWFDSILVAIPDHQILRSRSNFANQFSNQSNKIALLLYPFHFFW